MIKRFKSERGDIGDFFGWVILGVIILLFALAAGCFKLLDNDDKKKVEVDHDSLGRVELVSYAYTEPMHGFCINLPGETPNHCAGQVELRTEDEEKPQNVVLKSTSAGPNSLFPPSPGAIRDFVIGTIEAGLEMGQLFADTTIRFVSRLLIGIA